MEREKQVEMMKDFLSKINDLRSSIVEQKYIGVHRRDSAETLLQALEALVKDEIKTRTVPGHESRNLTAEMYISQALSLIKYDSNERHQT